MYLLDTNIISAVAPTKKRRSEAFVEWMRSSSDELFLSVVTASEILAGIHRVERLGHQPKAVHLRQWWSTVEHAYGHRFLPVDLAVARMAGEMLDRGRGHDVGYEDLAIAATAKVHGLILLTANERHFEPLGVDFLNPLKAIPRR